MISGWAWASMLQSEDVESQAPTLEHADLGMPAPRNPVPRGTEGGMSSRGGAVRRAEPSL